MNPCLNTIVSINTPGCTDCHTVASSGFDLLQAPEITLTGLGQTASETYLRGIELAKQKLLLAQNMLANDFRAILHSRRIATDILQPDVDTGTFRPQTVLPASDAPRGTAINGFRNGRSRLRKLKITGVQVYPLASKESATIRVFDGKAADAPYQDFPVTLVGGQVNNLNTIQYVSVSNAVRVLLIAPGVPLASAYLKCSCDGSMPNGVGTVEGFDGVKAVRREGFGLNVQFQNACDYNQLLCDLSKTYIGEILWLKTRMLLLEERLQTNRLNNWVMHGRDDIKEHMAAIDTEYHRKWEALSEALPSLLKTYRDDCLDCRSAHWKTNV